MDVHQRHSAMADHLPQASLDVYKLTRNHSWSLSTLSRLKDSWHSISDLLCVFFAVVSKCIEKPSLREKSVVEMWHGEAHLWTLWTCWRVAFDVSWCVRSSKQVFQEFWWTTLAYFILDSRLWSGHSWVNWDERFRRHPVARNETMLWVLTETWSCWVGMKCLVRIWKITSFGAGLLM